MKKGVCGCIGYDLDKGDDFKTVMTTMTFMMDKIGDFDDDTQRQVVRLLCSGIMNDGDHLQVQQRMCLTRRGNMKTFGACVVL